MQPMRPVLLFNIQRNIDLIYDWVRHSHPRPDKQSGIIQGLALPKRNIKVIGCNGDG